MSVVRTLVLFAVAAAAEIGGAWLVWQGVREHRGLAWVGAGIDIFCVTRNNDTVTSGNTFKYGPSRF